MTIQIEAVLPCGAVYYAIRDDFANGMLVCNLASKTLTASVGFCLKNGSSRGSRPERLLWTHMYLQSQRCKFTFKYVDCSCLLSCYF